MKWFSAFLSASIVGAFVGFYFWTYAGQKAYVKERDARLVAAAARSLRDAVQADESGSRVKRTRATLAVSGLADAGGGNYQVALADVLEGVALPGAFAALLVTDKTGAVLDQHPESRLDGLRHLSGEPAEGKPSDAQVAEGAALTRRATLRTLVFGERKLLAFCHPAALPREPEPPSPPNAKGAPTGVVADQAEGETLVVCGLVDEARLDHEASSVSPLALACLLVVFALTLLVPPFLKIPLLKRQQRLRFADVFGLATCQFLGLMIAATAIFGVACYYGLGARADDELRAIASDVGAHLRAELHAIELQMARNDETLARLPGRALQADSRMGRADLLARGPCQEPTPARDARERKRRVAAHEAHDCGAWTSVLPHYPFFETLAWIDPTGRQRVKWWTLGGNGPLAYFDVSRRAYFTDARDARLTRLPETPGSGFVLTSLRAWSNGEVRAVVSRPTSAQLGTATAPVPVVVQALTTRLITLTDPVLPAGTGFVLVDERGDVLFHSSARLSRTHNLFEETAGNPRLRAALLGRHADTLTARYWGRDHSLHVEPLWELPWSLVTFREHDWLRAVGVEALAEALLLCVGFSVGVFLLPALAYVALAGRRTPFPWPDPSLTWLYTHGSGTFAFIGALFLSGLARCHGEDALALALTLPVAAVVAAGVVLVGRGLLRRRWPEGPSARVARPLRGLTIMGAALLVASVSWMARTPLGLLVGACASALLALALIEGSERVARAGGFRWPHRVASTAFWLLFAVLPAVGFVKGATERALAACTARSQTLFLERLQQRARAVQKAYPDSLHAAQTLRNERLALEWDVFKGTLHDEAQAQCFASAQPAARGRSGPAAWLGDWLTRQRPFLAEHAVDLRYADAGRDPGASSTQRRPACARATPTTIVGAQPPTFAAIAGPWPWLVLALLTMATGAMVVWAERSLFATELCPPRTRTLAAIRSDTPAGTRRLILAPSGFELRDLLDGDWYERFTGTSASSDRRPWLLTEADLWAGDASARQTRLAAFEAALRDTSRAFVVVALRQPSAWQAEPAPGAAESARWRAAFECFERVVARAEFEAADADVLDTQVAAWLGGEKDARLHALVAAEMRASPYVFALCRARLQPGELRGRSRRAVLRRIEQTAESYYRSAWDACDADERLTLVQLAEEGFVNPRRLDVLESLLAKGLARLRPALEPMNGSFEGFLARAELRAPLEGAESEPATGFGWSHLRAPLFTLGAVVAAFIFFTEREIFDSATGLSTLVVGSVVPLLGQIARVARSVASADGGAAAAAAGAGGGGNAAA